MRVARRSSTPWVTLCLAAFFLITPSAGWADSQEDSNALTDDDSVAVPTGWWVYTNVSAATINTLTNQLGARVTDVEIHSFVGGAPRFTVRLVKNTGSYAVSGWWWYYGQTLAQVGQRLSTHKGRLIDIEPYSDGGTIRYAVVLVSNLGASARTWSYLSGVTSAQIGTHLSSTSQRLVDLDAYFVGSTKRYSAVFIANTGSDNKAWEWWLNQSVSGLSAKIAAFNGRIVDLDRQPDGTWNAILVKNTGSNGFGWWWGPSFTSTTAVIDYANQLALRPIDIETYVTGSGERRYAAVFIDNGNAATRRIRGIFGESLLDANGNPTRGIFEAYLKRVGSSVLVDLNSSRPAETASSLKVLHLLHTLRTPDSLGSSFVYYNYPSSSQPLPKDACPNPAEETVSNRKTDYNLEKGLDEMMAISDNRTTRGVVLRYGFNAINATANNLGLVGTELRHNIGCAYYNLTTGKYDTGRRNDTTAADLARIYEGVWSSTFLTGTRREEFLESANPATGVGDALRAIIEQEAAAQGKSSIADDFADLVQRWGKAGSYGTCLPDSAGGCGTTVTVASGAGIIRLPIKARGVTSHRTYVFGRFISDVPSNGFSDPQIDVYLATYSKAANELYREEVRSALLTW